MKQFQDYPGERVSKPIFAFGNRVRRIEPEAVFKLQSHSFAKMKFALFSLIAMALAAPTYGHVGGHIKGGADIIGGIKEKIDDILHGGYHGHDDYEGGDYNQGYDQYNQHDPDYDSYNDENDYQDGYN